MQANAPWPDAPALAQGEVHVWFARLDRGDWTGIAPDLLPAAERDRAARFRGSSKGGLWANSHGLLRLLLGGYLDADPASLRFEAAERGKPRLAQPHRDLCFSMSHSGATAAYAFALELELGVDVETLGRRRSVLPTALRAFGADAHRRLGQLEEDRREREFLQLWTRHEARLKCIGGGLGGKQRECWTSQLDAGEDVVAALAAARAPRSLACRRWS